MQVVEGGVEVGEQDGVDGCVDADCDGFVEGGW